MSFVLVDRPRPRVARVTLNRPERMNAMAFDVMVPLRRALEELGRDTAIRVVVLTGAGAGFCSGADLEDPGALPDVDGLTMPTIALRSMEVLDAIVLTLRTMHQPVLGAVNGPAIGGGLCLAADCDVRLASPAAVRSGAVAAVVDWPELDSLSAMIPPTNTSSAMPNTMNANRTGGPGGRTGTAGAAPRAAPPALCGTR